MPALKLAGRRDLAVDPRRLEERLVQIGVLPLEFRPPLAGRCPPGRPVSRFPGVLARLIHERDAGSPLQRAKEESPRRQPWERFAAGGTSPRSGRQESRGVFCRPLRGLVLPPFATHSLVAAATGLANYRPLRGLCSTKSCPLAPRIWAPAACLRLFNRLYNRFIGRSRQFLLRLLCYTYITVACILQVICRREPKNPWNHHSVPIISV